MSGDAELRLGDVADFVRGITFKPDDIVPLSAPRSIACMRTKNVQRELALDDVWAVPESFLKRADQKLAPGDILVSSANSWNLVGKCCWVPTLPWRSTFGGFVSVLRAKNKRVEPRYLYRWFSWDRTQAILRSYGQQTTNISNLNVERCLDLAIPIPSLAEQRRIADILDNAEALRTKRNAAILQLDLLARATFLDMFGDPAAGTRRWPVCTLADLRADFRYGTSNKSAEHGKPTLRIPNIVGGEIDLNDLKLVPVSDSEFARLQLRSGDLLFVRTNGNPDYIGRCAIFEGNKVSASGLSADEFIFASYLIRGRIQSDRANPTYLREMLQTTEGRRQLRARCKTSAGQYNINIEGLSAISIPLPPLSLQRKFVDRLSKVEQLRASHRASLGELQSLFTSLQHRAFRGELTSRAASKAA